MTPAVTGLNPADLSAEALAGLTERIAEYAAEYDRTGTFPHRSIEELHRSGALTATVGDSYGGPAISLGEQLHLVEAVGKGDPSVALILVNTLAAHSAQASAGLRPEGRWPEELYREALDRAQAGPVLINTARAEPELGAPARGGLPKTTAVRSGNGWALTGHKSYVTSSEGLTYHLVWAKTDDQEPRVGQFIVPGDAPGIRIEHTWDHLGLRASSTHDVHYTQVRIPEENFLEIPRQPDGRYVDPAQQGASLPFVAIYAGVAQAAQQFFTKFAHERVPAALGKPIAETERIQRAAGEIALQIGTARQLIHGLAATIDAGGEVSPRQLSTAKVSAVRGLTSAVQLAVEAIGNPGLTRHHPLQRHLRDVLSARVHPPQEDMALLQLGRAALNL